MSNNLKDLFFEESASIFKALSSPIRLKLINYISYCPRTVENCAKKFGQSVQNISLHLKALAKAGVLKVEKVKNFRVYSLTEPDVLEVLASKLITAPRSMLSEKRTWRSGPEQLALEVKKKKVVLVDLRDPEESAFLPIPSAIEFDPDSSNLERFLDEFSGKKDLVFFCRGRWCERMVDTVQRAAQVRSNVFGAGLNASQLEKMGKLLEGPLC